MFMLLCLAVVCSTTGLICARVTILLTFPLFEYSCSWYGSYLVLFSLLANFIFLICWFTAYSLSLPCFHQVCRRSFFSLRVAFTFIKNSHLCFRHHIPVWSVGHACTWDLRQMVFLWAKQSCFSTLMAFYPNIVCYSWAFSAPNYTGPFYSISAG